MFKLLLNSNKSCSCKNVTYKVETFCLKRKADSKSHFLFFVFLISHNYFAHLSVHFSFFLIFFLSPFSFYLFPSNFFSVFIQPDVSSLENVCGVLMFNSGFTHFVYLFRSLMNEVWPAAYVQSFSYIAFFYLPTFVCFFLPLICDRLKSFFLCVY